MLCFDGFHTAAQSWVRFQTVRSTGATSGRPGEGLRYCWGRWRCSCWRLHDDTASRLGIHWRSSCRQPGSFLCCQLHRITPFNYPGQLARGQRGGQWLSCRHAGWHITSTNRRPKGWRSRWYVLVHRRLCRAPRTPLLAVLPFAAGLVAGMKAVCDRWCHWCHITQVASVSPQARLTVTTE